MRMHVNMHNLISCSFMSDKQNDTKIKKTDVYYKAQITFFSEKDKQVVYAFALE